VESGDPLLLDDCAYFTPLLSDPFCGSIFFRTDVVDIGAERLVPNQYVGRVISEEFIASTNRPRPVSLPPDFDPSLYLAANPDVKAAGVDAKAHCLQFGRREGRRIRP
jgi:hypothetical protein